MIRFGSCSTFLKRYLLMRWDGGLVLWEWIFMWFPKCASSMQCFPPVFSSNGGSFL
jgi:hypothetical protein